MSLKQQLIQKAMTDAGQIIATIDANGGLIAECEALSELLKREGLDCSPTFCSSHPGHAVTWVQSSFGRPSAVRAAIEKAGLIIISDEIDPSSIYPNAIKIKLAGLTTHISIPKPAAELAKAA